MSTLFELFGKRLDFDIQIAKVGSLLDDAIAWWKSISTCGAFLCKCNLRKSSLYASTGLINRTINEISRRAPGCVYGKDGHPEIVEVTYTNDVVVTAALGGFHSAIDIAGCVDRQPLAQENWTTKFGDLVATR